MKRVAGFGLAVAASLLAGGWAGPWVATAAEAGHPAEVVAGRHIGRSPGKPRPPVNAHLVQAQGLEPGVPASLVLQLQGRPGIKVLDVQLEGGEGLSVVSATPSPGATAPVLQRSHQTAGEVAQWQIAATPTLSGTRYLSGLVTFRVNGVLQAAPFSLPVRVRGSEASSAGPLQKPMGSLLTTPGGELIDSMAAETTVR